MIEAGRWLSGNVFGIRRRIQGGRLLVNDEKREEQGLKERKASPIREHERISVFLSWAFKKEEQPVLEAPSLPLARRKRISPFSGN